MQCRLEFEALMKWDTLAECVAGVVEYASGQPYCVYPGGHATVVLLCVCCTVEVGWRERERGRENGRRGREIEGGREGERNCCLTSSLVKTLSVAKKICVCT